MRAGVSRRRPLVSRVSTRDDTPQAPGAIVGLAPEKLCVLLEGAVFVGGARQKNAQRRVDAPCVLDGFRFLGDDDANDREPLAAMAANDAAASGAVVAQIDERALARPLLKEAAAGCILAVVAAMAPDVRAFTAAGLSRRWLHAGAKLCSRGDAAPPHFYVIVTGRVRVARGGDDEKAPEDVEDVSRGGVVGLAAALTGTRSVDFDARCLRDAELVAVPRAALDGNGALWLQKLAGGLGRGAAPRAGNHGRTRNSPKFR